MKKINTFLTKNLAMSKKSIIFAQKLKATQL